jgi:hypothetical protein
MVPRSNQKVPKGKPDDTKAEIRRYQKHNLKLSNGEPGGTKEGNHNIPKR